MAWTDGVDKATNDVITAAIWNSYLGATGSLMQAAHLVANVATPTSTTSTSATDLVTISSLNIPATAGIRIVINCRKTATNANIVSFGLKLNSTVVIEPSNTVGVLSTATNRAEDGIGVFEIAPRATNYVTGIFGYYRFGDSTGVTAPALLAGIPTTPLPTAAITSIIIRAINHTNNNNAEVTSVQVWQLGL